MNAPRLREAPAARRYAARLLMLEALGALIQAHADEEQFRRLAEDGLSGGRPICPALVEELQLLIEARERIEAWREIFVRRARAYSDLHRPIIVREHSVAA